MPEEHTLEEVRELAQATTKTATALQVTDQESFDVAGTLLKEIKERLKVVKDVFGPMVKAAHESHKIAKGKMKEVEDPLKGAETTVKAAMSRYLAAEEKKRKDEERRIEEERQRAEAERQAKEQKQLDEAIALEEAGKTEEADAILDAPEPTPEPVAAPVLAPPPKTKGVSYRDAWKWDIVDESIIPRQFMMPDTKKIGETVRSLKADVTIPGVRIWSEKEISARG